MICDIGKSDCLSKRKKTNKQTKRATQNKLVWSDFVTTFLPLHVCRHIPVWALPWRCTRPSTPPECPSASACGLSPCPSDEAPHTGGRARSNRAPWDEWGKGELERWGREFDQRKQSEITLARGTRELPQSLSTQTSGHPGYTDIILHKSSPQ